MTANAIITLSVLAQLEQTYLSSFLFGRFLNETNLLSKLVILTGPGPQNMAGADFHRLTACVSDY